MLVSTLIDELGLSSISEFTYGELLNQNVKALRLYQDKVLCYLDCLTESKLELLVKLEKELSGFMGNYQFLFSLAIQDELNLDNFQLILTHILYRTKSYYPTFVSLIENHKRIEKSNSTFTLYLPEQVEAEQPALAYVENQLNLALEQQATCVIKFSSQLDIELQEEIRSLITDANTSMRNLTKDGYAKFKEKQHQEPRQVENKVAQKRYRKKVESCLWGRIYEGNTLISLKDANPDSGFGNIRGEVRNVSWTMLKNSNYKLSFDLRDEEGAIACIAFVKPDDKKILEKIVCNKANILAQANIEYDGRYAKDLQAKIQGVAQYTAESNLRTDSSEEKRVELHCHTKFSDKDGLIEPEELFETLVSMGHDCIAVTDHGIVQAFPKYTELADSYKNKGHNIKVIYGMEGYLVDDGPCCVYSALPASLNDSFVAIDVETTGLNNLSDRLIEVAALRYTKNADGIFSLSDEYTSLIQCDVDIPQKITELTGITAFDLLGQPNVNEVLASLHTFIGSDPIVGHNVLFDLGFLRAEAFRYVSQRDEKLKFNPIAIDSCAMSRAFLPDLPSYSLDSVARHLGIELNRHHRAKEDAACAANIFINLYNRLGQCSLDEINTRAGKLSDDDILAPKLKLNHIIILSANNLGLYNLYRLVSESSTRYYRKRPRIPRSLLDYLRTGLIIGSACEAGEVFRSILSSYCDSMGDYEAVLRKIKYGDFKKIGRYYDYFEIQPLANNAFLMQKYANFIKSDENLQELNKLIVYLAERYKKACVATCDAHYLNDDGLYRSILLLNQGFQDWNKPSHLYYRSTDEMLEEFSYLGEEKAREIVIKNTRKIASWVEDGIRAFPDGSFPPQIPESDEVVENMTYQKARAMYDQGKGLPAIIQKRLDSELKGLISSGYSIMYYIAHKVVKKSVEAGYSVGSRGSVGSSLVATMCDITEVNPLPPHYYCPNCRYSEFVDELKYHSGYDLPLKTCPECGHELIGEGQNIPFETFLGFSGNKQPDIDLNFSGEYQAKAHLYIEEMFGSAFTYKAGTITTYQYKNVRGMVYNYLKNINKTANEAEYRRLAESIEGVKSTTGQHPGGIVIIPKNHDVYEFTPVQYPAGKIDSIMQTTHFDFKSMHDTILKFDILGHLDPTVLHELSVLTGVDIYKIPITDEQVMSLFTSTKSLNFVRKNKQSSAMLGLPEMGTTLSRKMIEEVKPTRFYDLVQIMGLSHGTDVWANNAQPLVQQGICSIEEVIGCRDSIMTTLISKGIEPTAAFEIMEKVRKGKSITPEQESLLLEHNLPEWYIDSCKKIKYMFPKAHAVAYAVSALRIAWFKVYKAVAFYSAYYTVRADIFNANIMCGSYEKIVRSKEKCNDEIRERTANDKTKKSWYILEVIEEMYCRGIEFAPIDLYKSDAERFLPIGDKLILPPLDAIDGFSTAMANRVVEARQNNIFTSKAHLARLTGLGKTAIAALDKVGILKDMPDSEQQTIFDLFDSM